VLLCDYCHCNKHLPQTLKDLFFILHRQTIYDRPLDMVALRLLQGTAVHFYKICTSVNLCCFKEISSKCHRLNLSTPQQLCTAVKTSITVVPRCGEFGAPIPGMDCYVQNIVDWQQPCLALMHAMWIQHNFMDFHWMKVAITGQGCPSAALYLRSLMQTTH
jgi:hypothetical protein